MLVALELLVSHWKVATPCSFVVSIRGPVLGGGAGSTQVWLPWVVETEPVKSHPASGSKLPSPSSTNFVTVTEDSQSSRTIWRSAAASWSKSAVEREIRLAERVAGVLLEPGDRLQPVGAPGILHRLADTQREDVRSLELDLIGLLLRPLQCRHVALGEPRDFGAARSLVARGRVAVCHEDDEVGLGALPVCLAHLIERGLPVGPAGGVVAGTAGVCVVDVGNEGLRDRVGRHRRVDGSGGRRSC